MESHESVDVVVVGGGAGGLVAAIFAKMKGLSVMLVEKSDVIGGSSALSGGGLWIPNNHVSKNAGLQDSYEEALLYMETVIEHDGLASSKARKEAFLLNGPKMVRELEEQGIKWLDGIKYPDYYPDQPGGKIGRSIECDVFDLHELGEHQSLLRNAGMEMPFPIHSGNVAPIPRTFATFNDFKEVMGMVMKGMKLKAKGEKSATIGQALMGRLLQLALKVGVDIRVNSPIEDVLIENDEVVGIQFKKDNHTIIAKTKAVILASGGFDHNKELRKKYHNLDVEWSSGSPSNTGDLLQLAEKYELDTELLDDAWWGPTIVDSEGNPTFMVTERSLPHSIIVDSKGERCFNESESYVDAGHAMLKKWEENGNKEPFWIIFDNTYHKRYIFGTIMPRLTPKKAIESGFLIQAASIAELAEKCNLQPDALRQTIDRFNHFAAKGKDEDFGRGNTAYDRYYGDPTYKNPNLGVLTAAPFYAAKVYPGDLGTKGGFVTDEHAQVLKKGEPIKGLYAVGNCSASVMGRTYPGPGSTLGPAAVFGYIAAHHAATL